MCNKSVRISIVLLLSGFTSLLNGQTAYETYRWIKPETHRLGPARPLNLRETALLRSVQLPARCDYSRYVTFVRDQASGGCGGMTVLAILDILKEREFPYTPDSSYRFNQYLYDEAKYPKCPREYELNQGDVVQLIGSCPEADFPSEYDDPASLPVPNRAQYLAAAALRTSGYSDLIWPLTVDQLKRMLVRFGPLAAKGDTPASAVNAHVFTLIGYDDTTATFTVLNSFGDKWGKNGMMAMPYSNITALPAAGTTPRITQGVHYHANRPTPAGSYPFTARLNISHTQNRHHLIVKIGVGGQAAVTVWNHPNQNHNSDYVDTSLNLVIDVPLPGYARGFWPPSDRWRWYVEVTDDSPRVPGNKVMATINELTLVDRRPLWQGSPPVLYRPSARGLPVRSGETVKVWVPTKTEKVLMLTSDRASVAGNGQATFSGSQMVRVEAVPGDVRMSAMSGVAISLYKVTRNPVEGIVLGEVVGRATTDPAGRFKIPVTVTATAEYQAVATKADGSVLATSTVRRVEVFTGVSQKPRFGKATVQSKPRF